MRIKLAILFLSMLLLLIACQPAPALEPECQPVKIYTHNIRALPELSAAIEGTFFLASGTVESKSMYQFYEIQEGGSAAFVEIPVNTALVFEQADLLQPYVEFYRGINSVNQHQCSMDRELYPYLFHMVDTVSVLGVTEWYQIYIPIGGILKIIEGSPSGQ